MTYTSESTDKVSDKRTLVEIYNEKKEQKTITNEKIVSWLNDLANKINKDVDLQQKIRDYTSSSYFDLDRVYILKPNFAIIRYGDKGCDETKSSLFPELKLPWETYKVGQFVSNKIIYSDVILEGLLSGTKLLLERSNSGKINVGISIIKQEENEVPEIEDKNSCIIL